ncbi:MAG TPA: hypothetical protein VJ654_07750 [Noviherbaspirillum sp.]|nr:hypothetical protein [Noviherbaspirillum sp.]
MKVPSEEMQQRLGFIDRTIYHAMQACHSDSNAPKELKDCVQELGQRSSQAKRALNNHDEHGFRQSVDDLAQLSDRAQNTIHPTDPMNYEVKSAVILAHIELSALRYQLD